MNGASKLSGKEEEEKMIAGESIPLELNDVAVIEELNVSANPDQPSSIGLCPKFIQKRHFLYPLHLGIWNLLISFSFCLILVYLLLLSLTGSRASPPVLNPQEFKSNQTISPSTNLSNVDATSTPNGDLFALFILLVSAAIGGLLVEFTGLPSLLGMIAVGLLLRNVPLINIGKNIDPEIAKVLRQTAFVIILIQGGLSLDLQAVRKLSGTVLRLAFIPCLIEASTLALASCLFFKLPILYGFLLGFVIGAVSPAVCVPSMLSLMSKGYGKRGGIVSLVIAASSTDDVLAITGFSVLLSLAFAKGEIWWIILRGPLDMMVGIVYGLLIGFALWFFPHHLSEHTIFLRYASLLLGSLVSMFGSGAIGMEGAGALGVIVLSCTAAFGWKKTDANPQHLESIQKSMELTWKIFEPMLFGLIGAEVDIISSGLAGLAILISFGVLLAGIVTRCLAAFLAVIGANYSAKERIFITVAWLPKATVQAALGPIVLDNALKQNPPDELVIEYGYKILSVAVLSILLTAPLGAALISLLGPRLLTKDTII